MDSLNAIDYFNKKGAEFQSDFSALFSKLKVDAPVTGTNIQKLVLADRRLSTIISDIINGNGFEMSNFAEGSFLDKASGVVNQIVDTAKEVKAQKEIETDIKKVAEKKNSAKFIKIGILTIISLTILIVIIKMGTK